MLSFDYESFQEYNIHNLLLVRTNIIRVLPKLLLNNYINEQQLPKLHIEVSQFSSDLLASIIERSKHYALFDTQKFLSGKKIIITDLEKNESGFYMLLQGTRSKFKKIGNWITKVVPSLLQFKLLNSGATFLHAATLDICGDGLVLCAPTDIGKTTTTFLLLNLLPQSAKILSDDLVIFANGNIYSYPIDVNIHTTHIKICQLKINNKQKLLLELYKILGYIYIPGRLRDFLGISKSPRIPVPIEELFKVIQLKTKPEMIVALKRGTRYLREISAIDMARLITTMGWLGAPFFKFVENKMLVEYAYAHNVDVWALYQKMYNLYLNLAEKAKCYEISGTVTTYYEDIFRLLKR